MQAHAELPQGFLRSTHRASLPLYTHPLGRIFGGRRVLLAFVQIKLQKEKKNVDMKLKYTQ